jgi:hypothetical protein
MVRSENRPATGNQALLYDFFISYAVADEEWVRGYLIYTLENAGKTCLTAADFQLGHFKVANIQDAVIRSGRTLLILSPEYLHDLDSEEGRLREFATFLASHFAASNGSWSVIPVKRREVELPPHLKFLQGLDCRDEQRSRSSLQKLLSPGELPKESPERPPCPYPGLAAYREEHSQQFFGRSKLAETLVQKLSIHPFLVIVGASGSGKSSLAHAGVIPALRQSPLFGAGGWHVAAIRPGDAPLSALDGAVENLRTNPQATTKAKHLLLFIDQFEELFTHAIGSSERDEFVSLLAKLASLPQFYLLLAIREDFFRMLMATPLGPLVEEEQGGGLYQKHYYDLPPLGKAELAEIIREPARQVGVYVDQLLVERMVNDAGSEPGILPFLQATMVYLWNALQLRYLPVSTYEQLQYGQEGQEPVKGLKAAIALHAEHVFARLDIQQQALAQRIFIRLLEFVEGRPEMRRQQPVANLRGDEDPHLFDNTLGYLATQRLLTVSSKGEDHRVDIAHEALIEAWPAYQAWINIWGEVEKQRRSLENKYHEWEKLGRKGGLLDKVQLKQALQWNSKLRATGLKPDSRLTKYIKRSRRVIRRTLLVKILLPLMTVIILIVAYYVEKEWRNFQNLRTIFKENPQQEITGGTYSIGPNDDPELVNYSIHSVTVQAFYMDTYEVTNRWYCLCYQAGGCKEFRFDGYDVCSMEENEKYKPIVNINRFLADEYCQWIGGSLPSAIEWEAAARGKNAYIYPTGNDKPISSVVNIGEDDQDSILWKVKDTEKDKASSGICGLTGNASEWTNTSAIYSDKRIRPEASVIKGGNAYSLELTKSSEVNYRPNNDTNNDFLGFRCVRHLNFH